MRLSAGLLLCTSSVVWVPVQRQRRRVDEALLAFGQPREAGRRAIQPRRAYWTLPAGFMENGETTLEGARRETWEEARARVEGESLYTIFDLPHISQVYMFYLARLSAPEFAAGPESLEVALFDEDAIPWDELAFPVVNATLERFFADRRHGIFPVHNATLRPGDWGRGVRRS